MRICPKCLSVYGSSRFTYCPEDGELTYDTADDKAQEAIKQAIIKLNKEWKEDDL